MRILVDGAASIGEREAAPAALAKREAEALLQGVDLKADRRLAHGKGSWAPQKPPCSTTERKTRSARMSDADRCTVRPPSMRAGPDGIHRNFRCIVYCFYIYQRINPDMMARTL